MEAREEELIQTLTPQNETLRVATAEHGRLKALVDELKARPHLSPEEEVRKKDLQKRKLAEKDKIRKILDDHRRAD